MLNGPARLPGLYYSFLVTAFLFLMPTANSQTGEEFTGDFASWANVKKRFRAVGDGKKDDT